MSKADKVRKKELQALAAKAERDIDTEDMPEVTDWSDAVIGKFYRPVKKQVTIRIDADVLAWFRSPGGQYQTEINRALRKHIREHQDRRID